MIYKSDAVELSQVLVPFLVFCVESGNVFYATPAAEDIFACSVLGGLVGKDIKNLIPGVDFSSMSSGKPIEVSLCNAVGIDSSTISVTCGFAAAVRAGVKVGVLTVLRACGVCPRLKPEAF